MLLFKNVNFLVLSIADRGKLFVQIPLHNSSVVQL